MKSKAQKRLEAAERQAAHDKLTHDEKINKTFSRPGNSAKERARLLATR